MRKLKNITAQTIKRNGVRIDSGQYYSISSGEEREWVTSQILGDIDNNILIVNENNVDLTDKTAMKAALRNAVGLDRIIVKSLLYGQSNSTSYKKISEFIYQGSDILGTSLYGKITAYISRGGTGSIRLYAHDTRKVLYEKTDITNFNPQIIDFDSLTNLPTGESIIEIQCKSNNSNKTISINYFEIRW